MSPHRLLAAEYLRMSSDRQDLSLDIQRKAIRDYAAAHGISVIANYEDQGRSGLSLKRRESMKRMLRDVETNGCPFSLVLVYDVSRWGRFQDTDASAYYEYHCRLHGVEVIYVEESFSSDRSPMTAIAKNLKRVMAAEYSRELGIKARAGQDWAIDLGFQMGTPPCLGLTRVAVSKDGTRARELGRLERKGYATDRIRWVPGPESEIQLVRRIFHLYATTSISIRGLRRLLTAEGQVDGLGRAFSVVMLGHILKSEAYVGNFVWGRVDGGNSRRRAETEPGFKRVLSVIAPIIDVETWTRTQVKRFWTGPSSRTRPELLRDLSRALEENPRLTALEMPSHMCKSTMTYTREFGSMDEAFRLVGRDFEAARIDVTKKRAQGTRIMWRLLRDLESLLTMAGLVWTRSHHSRIFVINDNFRLRPQFSWKRRRWDEFQWFLPTFRWPSDYILLVRMLPDETAQDFTLLRLDEYRGYPHWSQDTVAGMHRIRSKSELTEALNGLACALTLPIHSTPLIPAKLQANHCRDHTEPQLHHAGP